MFFDVVRPFWVAVGSPARAGVILTFQSGAVRDIWDMDFSVKTVRKPYFVFGIWPGPVQSAMFLTTILTNAGLRCAEHPKPSPTNALHNCI